MTTTLMTQAIALGRELIELTGCTPCDLREVLPNIMACHMGPGLEDFQVNLGGNEWRFIQESAIDSILKEELEADPYMLGCFAASCIANNSDIDKELVEIIQGAEAYENLGQHLIDNDCVEGMADDLASMDGYGHHFASYDGATNELRAVNYYAFNCG